MERSELLRRYACERERLRPLAEKDSPAGEYLHPVFGAGALPSPVMLVGEAPGAEETRLSRPFSGRAGKHLDGLLAATRIPREALYITNVVKYRPVVRTERSTRNRTPTREEIAASLPLLLEEIRLVRPKVVVTLGNTPLWAVLALAALPPATVGRLHGRPVPLRLAGAERELFPLYHPASGIYNRSLLPIMERDTAALGEHLVKAAEIVLSASSDMI